MNFVGVETVSGEKIYINPDHIVMIEKADRVTAETNEIDKETSIITFMLNEPLLVKGDPKNVAQNVVNAAFFAAIPEILT